MDDNFDQYGRNLQQSRENANIMRKGTGAASLLQAENAPTHQIDALQRFQKDFASYEKQRRQSQYKRRNEQLERRRIEILQRENKRWMIEQNNMQKMNEKQLSSQHNQLLGRKRTANMNGLPFNPITLQYDKNPEGHRLKLLDDDNKVRSYVRAHNMERYGNSKYNPLNGLDRVGIEHIVPVQLSDKFQKRKFQHYDNLKVKLPTSLNVIPYSQYAPYY